MTTTTAIDFKDQDRGTGYTYRGSEHGGVPVPVIADRSRPGEGPALHRCPPSWWNGQPRKEAPTVMQYWVPPPGQTI